MKKIHSYLLAIAALLVFAPGLSAQTTYDELFGTLNFPADTSGFSEESNIGFKKNISEPKDNKYWLKLEAFATGSATQTSKAVPSDVILVLDLSSSMDRAYPGYESRLAALKDATKKFVNSIYQNALDQGEGYEGNRIAIVTYAGNQYIDTPTNGWVDVDATCFGGSHRICQDCPYKCSFECCYVYRWISCPKSELGGFTRYRGGEYEQ